MYPTIVGMKTDMSGVLTVCILIKIVFFDLLPSIYDNCYHHCWHSKYSS